MISTKLEQLRKKLPRNNQQGFTLIELLVVISILGILAAVVTMSLVGVQAAATKKAQQAELATVQTAFDSDVLANAADSNMDTTAACNNLGRDGTNNLASFPSGHGGGLTAGGGAPQDLPSLYSSYIRIQLSKWTYYCADPSTGTLGSR
jgi:prepilin-type N-terminal cleavage/methylation domain-containing protein